MKKLGILLLAAAFAVCGLMTFAACNEETPGPGDDPIVTPGPDDPGKPEEPGEPTPPDEPEATEGLVFELLTTENSDGFEEILGADFEDCYVCTGLTTAEENVVIPSTYNGLPVRVVRAYGEESDAFNGITSLYIPDSVQLIQWNEYDTFESLTEIRLPRNPNAMIYGSTLLSGCAFYNDPNNWDNGALYMDDWLLATNDDLPEEYTVKQGTYGIADSAFRGSGVKKVTVPDGIQSLVGSFCSCDSLEEVVLPDSLSSIGYCTFLGCFSLESITIPDGVTSIGAGAFSYCIGLESITVPDSVTAIGYEVFSACDSLTSIKVNEGNSVYHSEGNCLIETKSKTLIAGCKTSVIPSDGSVTSIGDDAFSDCNSLTSITIPDSVTSIGYAAFIDCSSLTSITIPDSVTFIGDGAFYGCSSLTSVTIGNSVTFIGDAAFLLCDSLTSITIPDSVTSIGDWAFSDCSSLTSITIPDSVTSIGYGAFEDTAYYSDDVNWKDGILYIGDHLIKAVGTISGDYSVKEGTKTIAGRAFSGCASLTSITIPDSVTSIGEWAFYGCSSLTSVTIPDSVTSIGGYAFYYCSSLTSVAIGDGVTSIGKNAFSRCESLSTVYYRGSEAEWNEIEISLGNDGLEDVEIVFNYTGE